VAPPKKNPGVVSLNPVGSGTASPNRLNMDKQKPANPARKPGNKDTG